MRLSPILLAVRSVLDAASFEAFTWLRQESEMLQVQRLRFAPISMLLFRVNPT